MEHHHGGPAKASQKAGRDFIQSLFVPKTDCLKIRAYIRVLQELSDLGVLLRYVGGVWRKHKEDILIR